MTQRKTAARAAMPCVLFLFLSSAAGAGERAFTLADAPETGVLRRGKPLIVAESLVFVEPRPMDAAGVERRRDAAADGAQLDNAYAAGDAFSWRREIAVSGDGSEVEITFQCRADSDANAPRGARKTMRYTFSVDARLLDGMRFKARTGRSHAATVAEGVVDAGGPNGALISSTTRYLAFAGDDGRGLVFDFNPEGVTSFGDYGPGSLQGLWGARKEGDRIVFSLSTGFQAWGGSGAGKAVIFEGAFEDFPNRHACNKYSYASDAALEYERAFVFGAEKFGDFYADAGQKAYDAKAGFGWVDPKGLKTERFAPSGALYSSVGSDAPAVFKAGGLRPGVYFVTVRSAAHDKPIGPFSVALNGTVAASDISLKSRRLATITFPIWIEGGTAEFSFSGRWRVSAVVMQLLMHSKEDFKFRRGIWRADLFEPSVLFRNAHYARPPAFQTVVDKTALAPHDARAPEGYTLRLKKETALPPDSDGLAWRYTGVLGDYGPDNNGDFDHFAAPEEKARLVARLKADRIDAIIVNGLHTHHTHPAHLDRMRGFVRDLTRLAHENKMHVVSHHSAGLLWNMDSGFRVMTERTDSLLRRVDGCGVARGLCPANPISRKEYIDRILRLVVEADIDGVMADEVMFFNPNLCGCRHCREGFAADTGLALPMDETSPRLFNKKDTLWKAWLEWRKKASADFFVELRKAATEVKADFSLLGYTTNYGWSSNWASLDEGSDLVAMGRALDFLGTEIMTRNAMALRRPVMAYRKMKTALRHPYSRPVFGLVYPQGDWSIAYFGWALNHMNRQSTWSPPPPAPPPGADSDYLAFAADGLSPAHLHSAARTALFFSPATRDWSRHFAYAPEPLGISEILTDRHLMHDFALPDTLTAPGGLDGFRNLFLLNAMCLDDAEVKAVRAFAQRGGTVFLSAHAGIADALGQDRANWPFADVFGFSPRQPMALGAVSSIATDWGEAAFPEPAWMPTLAGADQAKGKTRGTAVSAGGAKIPFLFEAPRGKGRMVYCALPLGNLVVELEQNVGEKYKPAARPELHGLLGDMLRDLFFAGDDFEAVAVPAKVMASISRHAAPGQPEALLVHLLNATGVDLAADAVIPAAMPVDWGRITEPIVFRIRRGALTEAYAASPDFKGPQAVAFREAGRGVWEVSVAPEQLKHYTVIHLR